MSARLKPISCEKVKMKLFLALILSFRFLSIKNLLRTFKINSKEKPGKREKISPNFVIACCHAKSSFLSFHFVYVHYFFLNRFLPTVIIFEKLIKSYIFFMILGILLPLCYKKSFIFCPYFPLIFEARSVSHSEIPRKLFHGGQNVQRFYRRLKIKSKRYKKFFQTAIFSNYGKNSTTNKFVA